MRLCGVAAVVTLSTLPAPGALAQGAEVTIAATPAVVVPGHPVTLSGAVPPGTLARLWRSPYPYGNWQPLRTAAPGADGSFTFEVYPDRNTIYRVESVGAGTGADVSVGVRDLATITSRPLPLGRALVRILLRHPGDLRWNGARVRWWFAVGRRGRLRPAASTRTLRLGPDATVVQKVVTLPAGAYGWRACLLVPGAGAFVGGTPSRGCGGREYSGRGSLPVGYPSPSAVGRATRLLSRRAGRTAFAVIDSEGRMSGWHQHWRFVSASVVKAMLLVAYLRQLHGQGQHRLDPTAAGILYPMIHLSDNTAATAAGFVVGDSGLYRVAGAAGMRDFSVSGIWASAQISAADQARFFFRMDALIPPEYRGYAHWLLSTIVDYESWGIPAVARPRGYAVYFKGGWRGTGLGQLVHQVARLRGHGRTFAMAVLTDGDPSMGYGIGTIQALTGSLLWAPPPRR